MLRGCGTCFFLHLLKKGLLTLKTSKKLLSVLLSVLLLALTMTVCVVPVSAAEEYQIGENVWASYSEAMGSVTINGTGPTYSYGTAADDRSPFYGNSSITSVSVSEGITAIGDRLFLNCTNLETLTLPESLTLIGTYAFANTGLKSLVLPKGMQTVGSWAFYNCQLLLEVTLYADIQSIGDSAFWKCHRMQTVYFYGNEDQWNEITIEDYNTWFKEKTTRVYLVEVTLIAGEGGFVGETGGKKKEVIRVPYAELIEICAWPSEGYHFVAWIYNDISFDTEETVDFRPDRNMTITATFAKDEAPSGSTGQTDPEPQPANRCPWCGGEHNGFFGKIVGWFHSILAKIFGAKY